MKIDQYDLYVNIFVSVLAALVVGVSSLGATYLVLLAVQYGLSNFLDTTLPIWIFHAIPWLCSIPLTFVFWASRVPLPYGCQIQLRDFWIRFGVIVKFRIDDKNIDDDEMDAWLKEHISSLYRYVGRTHGGGKIHEIYAFLSAKDATAFKLRWDE